MIKVLIADDHPVVRLGLRQLLRAYTRRVREEPPRPFAFVDAKYV